MVESSGTFDKFVRLNLTGEIVEVVKLDSIGITINYRGKHLTMNCNEVSCVTLEEIGREKIFQR